MLLPPGSSTHSPCHRLQQRTTGQGEESGSQGSLTLNRLNDFGTSFNLCGPQFTP